MAISEEYRCKIAKDRRDFFWFICFGITYEKATKHRAWIETAERLTIKSQA